MRLRLYRRIASLKAWERSTLSPVNFSTVLDRSPNQSRTLLYQVKVKILAEAASLSAVSGENGMIVLRYPPLPDGIIPRFSLLRAGCTHWEKQLVVAGIPAKLARAFT
jgi:hypothetical protein